MISSFVVFGQPKESIRVSIRQHGSDDQKTPDSL